PDPNRPISVEEAQQRVLQEVVALAAVEVPVHEAHGRVLREDVIAPEDVPASDNSAMDGFAVRASDIIGANSDRPAALTILGEVAADSDPEVLVRGGAAARIMTGGAIPEGADAVIQVEETDAGENTVRIYRAGKAGLNIRRRGEDMRRGDVVLRSGIPLNAGELGVAVTARRKTVMIGPQPSVAILSTGDEIVSGRVANSNAITLAALTREAGAVPHVFDAVPDDQVATREALEKALKYDLIITSGGVSHGVFDFVKDALDDLGAETKFWQVAMKPGKPVIFSRIGEKVAFGLPGNPVSCIVGFLLFVRPALRKMMGQTSNLMLPALQARAAERFESRGERRMYFRVRLVSESGEIVAHAMRAQGSGISTSMVGANGLAWLDVETPHVDARSPIPVLVFGPIASE
ncbi:MAG TPA: gephyrin-like molybdotransferase Glp, partial [Thermoanaerobaculia bacterium]|nr:gephyrin-like molybdotransferase Glp [Thermoanaerobaculia bacterium]